MYGREDLVKEFFQRELEANTTRKKDISGLNYLTIDFSRLPDLNGVPDEEGEIADIYRTLKTLDGKQMLNLSPSFSFISLYSYFKYT